MIVKTTFNPRREEKLLRAVLFFLATSVLACGPNADIQPASPANPPAPQVDSDVLIMPLGQKTKEQLAYWTREDQRLVLAYFEIFLRHGFHQKTNYNVTVTGESFEADSLELDFQSVDENHGTEWWSYVPVSGRVEYDGRFPDYVLIFDGLRFRIRSGGGARQSYDVAGGGTAEVELEYVLWDNRTQEIAALGRLHEATLTSTPHPSSDLFKELFERMAEEVVRNSPLT